MTDDDMHVSACMYIQGGGAGVHKVFGRKKLEKRREANETFLVKSTAEGETLDEETVIQRVIDFFNETQQVGQQEKQMTPM